MKGSETNPLAKLKRSSLLLLLAILFGAMAVLCHQAFLHHRVMWANDSQLGAIKSTSARLPDTYTGHWLDSWWIGADIPASSPSVTLILATFISPAMFLKIFTPFTMLFLGFSAWVFFRRLKFSPMVCVLGGLAAGLNMHCFSNGCWGLGTWTIAVSMVFLALAVLVTDSIRQMWIKAAFAGLAVGMSVMEGFDSGAILSVYVAVFILFYFWISESSMAARLSKSIVVGVLVVVFAVLIAASTIATLVGTQIQGISAGRGAALSAAEKEAEKKSLWHFDTTWSLPKLETLRVIIPGIFGYRMEEFMTTDDKSAAYWGRVGEDPHVQELESSDPNVRANAVKDLHATDAIVNVERTDNMAARAQILEEVKNQVQRRHSGNGEYAGILVALLAVFAVLNSWRGKLSPYTRNERLMVWFFSLAAIFSLMAAWGRFSFLYPLLFKLPYVSVIRNTVKFMRPFLINWVILAGFGAEALSRCCVRSEVVQSAVSKALPTRSWWQKLSGFNKGCVVGLPLLLVVAIIGLWFYAGSEKAVAQYLVHNGFEDRPNRMPDMAGHMAAFSVREVAWSVFFLALSVGVVVSALAGAWQGRKAALAWAFLCGIMVFDLGRSDVPWVRYFNYDQKYSMNDITKILEDKPYEHRVVGRLSPRGGYDLPGDGNFGAMIHWWIENDFPYHDIQSLEIDQMPRMPDLDARFLGALYPRAGNDYGPAARMWKLTNTRYLLAAADDLAELNRQVDPVRQPFRYVARFDFVPKPWVPMTTNATGGVVPEVEDAGDLTPRISEQGPHALIEDTDVLPRAKLFANWIVQTNDDQTLQTLASPRWDPAKSVLVSQDTPVSHAPGNATADPGTVSITDYAPKDIKLEATAKTGAVLLYTDRIAPAWNVWVDQKPAPLLRCNYIMRGVFVPAGKHTIEFKFQPSIRPLCVTLTAFAMGLALAAYLLWSRLAMRFAAKAG